MGKPAAYAKAAQSIFAISLRCQDSLRHIAPAASAWLPYSTLVMMSFCQRMILFDAAAGHYDHRWSGIAGCRSAGD
jgi:hypothetical protein